MLSPDDIFTNRQGRAGSVWSFDSGYASGMIEDDEQLDGEWSVSVSKMDVPVVEHEYTHTSSDQSVAGLGISGLLDTCVNDRLQQHEEYGVPTSSTNLSVYTVREKLNCSSRSPQNPGQEKCVARDLEGKVKREACLQPGHEHNHEHARPNTPLPCLHIPNQTFSHTDCTCESTPGGKLCAACAPDLGLASPVSPATSEIRRSRAGRSSKLSVVALRHLQSWLDAHLEHPYPTPEEKATLARECGITVKQVCTWFTNTRARHLKAPEEYRPPTREYDDEHITVTTPGNSSYHSSEHIGELATPHRSPAIDNGTPQLSSRRGRKKDYRRNNAASPAAMISPAQPPRHSNPEASEATTWQCTFCCQALAPKSWRRHEETQHRPKHIWVCLATNSTIIPPSRRNSLPLCIFCGLQNPSSDHCFNAHRVSECMHKPESERTFLRPDHLRQHVKNFHKTNLDERVRDMWRKDGSDRNTNEGWTCGFCDENLPTWDNRETHIAGHFKDGLTMADWKISATQDVYEIKQEVETEMAMEPELELKPEPRETMADMFDFGGPLLPDMADWDMNMGFGGGGEFEFGSTLMPAAAIQDPMTDPMTETTYNFFQDQPVTAEDINAWASNTMDWQQGSW